MVCPGSEACFSGVARPSLHIFLPDFLVVSEIMRIFAAEIYV
jgi:hypothetical protein